MSLVWITGIGGFVGAHLTLHLRNRGFRVAGIANRHAPVWADDTATETAIEMGGITTEACARLLARTGRPMAVFHLGGASSPGPTLHDPLSDFEMSLAPTAALFAFVLRHCPETPLVIASSAAVYGAGHEEPIDECAALRPASPYGAHKRAIEGIALDYGRTHGLRSIALRIFSVYGPGLRRQIVWDLCRRLAAGEHPVTLSGTGEETRDYLHIDDLTPLLLECASYASFERSLFNVGSGQATTIRALAETVVDAWDLRHHTRSKIAFDGRPRPGDPSALVANTGRLQARTGFTLTVPFAAGIAQTVRWFQDTHAASSDQDATGLLAAVVGRSGGALDLERMHIR